VVNAEYNPHEADRLAEPELPRLRAELAGHGVTLYDGADAPERLAQLRILYEPYLHSLSRRLLMTLPPWIHAERKKDNWQGSPWDHLIQARALEHPGHVGRKADDHF